MLQTISLNQVQQDLPTFIKKAGKTKYFIPVKGSSGAVLMSRDEYESLEETLDILSDQKLMRELRQAEKEIAEGKGIPWEDVKKEMGHRATVYN